MALFTPVIVSTRILRYWSIPTHTHTHTHKPQMINTNLLWLLICFLQHAYKVTSGSFSTLTPRDGLDTFTQLIWVTAVFLRLICALVTFCRHFIDAGLWIILWWRTRSPFIYTTALSSENRTLAFCVVCLFERNSGKSKWIWKGALERNVSETTWSMPNKALFLAISGIAAQHCSKISGSIKRTTATIIPNQLFFFFRVAHRSNSTSPSVHWRTLLLEITIVVVLQIFTAVIMHLKFQGLKCTDVHAWLAHYLHLLTGKAYFQTQCTCLMC